MVVGRDTHMHCDTHGCYDKGPWGSLPGFQGPPLLSLACHLSHAHLCRFGPFSASGCEKVKKSIMGACRLGGHAIYYGRGIVITPTGTGKVEKWKRGGEGGRRWRAVRQRQAAGGGRCIRDMQRPRLHTAYRNPSQQAQMRHWRAYRTVVIRLNDAR